MSRKDIYKFADQLEELIKKHGKDQSVSRDFNNLHENAQRVRFAQNLLNDYKLIADSGKLSLPKSNAISDSCRDRGNQFYLKSEFLNALDAYNQSLCFAEPGSPNVGLAYANRSAVFVKMELYSLGLRNIQLARKNKYPIEKLEKLEEREASCREMIENEPKNRDQMFGEEFLKLTRRPNEKLPFIVDCLEVKFDKKYGRCITTKVPLKPGDVVCVEEPFMKLLSPTHRFKYCATCLKDNALDLFACDNCTATMFCSKECANIGNEKFHKFECPIVDKLNMLMLDQDLVRYAVRTFFEALVVCDGNLQELKALIEENRGSVRTVFDFEAPMDGKNLLRAIDALKEKQAEEPQTVFFIYSVAVAIISNLFMKHTPLADLLTSDEDQDFFYNFIFKQSQVAGGNLHELKFTIGTKLGSPSPQHGLASFPFSSLINHSCAPNVFRLSLNSKNIIVVWRKIAVGGQLFEFYSAFHHFRHGFVQRQMLLQAIHAFKCVCEACTNKYPLLHDLPKTDPNFHHFFDGGIEKLATLDLESAKEKYESFCNYIQKHDTLYPSYEVSVVQSNLMYLCGRFAMSELKMKFCAK